MCSIDGLVFYCSSFKISGIVLCLLFNVIATMVCWIKGGGELTLYVYILIINLMRVTVFMKSDRIWLN